MIPLQQRSTGTEGVAGYPAPEVWLEHTAVSVAELLGAIDEITATMESAGYGLKDVFGLRLALEEAGVNAIKHGHRDCRTKPIWIRYHVTPDQALVEIEDQGPGFDPEHVPDPLAPENLEKPSGRGLLLMRSYTNWLRYNQRGNCVILCKQRSPGT